MYLSFPFDSCPVYTCDDLMVVDYYFVGGVKSVLLSRLLHCVGHVAQWQLIHCECSIHNHRRGALTASKEAQPQSKVTGQLYATLIRLHIPVYV